MRADATISTVLRVSSSVFPTMLRTNRFDAPFTAYSAALDQRRGFHPERCDVMRAVRSYAPVIGRVARCTLHVARCALRVARGARVVHRGSSERCIPEYTARDDGHRDSFVEREHALMLKRAGRAIQRPSKVGAVQSCTGSRRR